MGVSLAMESVAVLAEKLSRADSASVPLALSTYVARRLMYTGNRLVAWLRDAAVRVAADEKVLDLVHGVLAARI